METKEVKINIPEGYEIDKENSTFECIKFKKKVEVNTWKDIRTLSGTLITSKSDFYHVPKVPADHIVDKNIFISVKYAKSALALAQISQLMPYYGGEITNEEWKNDNWKYSIDVDAKGLLYLSQVTHNKQIVAFHTHTQRDRFLSFPENVQLVKDLYMID